jgi:hypothetical protein
MSKLLLLSNNITPFTASWGAKCATVPCNEGYILPDGWQEELTEHGVTYTEVDSEEITFPEPE